MLIFPSTTVRILLAQLQKRELAKQFGPRCLQRKEFTVVLNTWFGWFPLHLTDLVPMGSRTDHNKIFE